MPRLEQKRCKTSDGVCYGCFLGSPHLLVRPRQLIREQPRGSIIYRMEPKKTLKQFGFYTDGAGLSSIQSSFKSQKIKKGKPLTVQQGGRGLRVLMEV